MIPITVITVPVAIFVPATFVAIPPSMELAPTTLSRSVQVSSPVICLTAALAVFANGIIKSCFGLFDSTMALCSVVVVRTRTRRASEQQKRAQQRGRDHRFPKSRNIPPYVQGIPPVHGLG